MTVNVNIPSRSMIYHFHAPATYTLCHTCICNSNTVSRMHLQHTHCVSDRLLPVTVMDSHVMDLQHTHLQQTHVQHAHAQDTLHHTVRSREAPILLSSLLLSDNMMRSVVSCCMQQVWCLLACATIPRNKTQLEAPSR